MSIRARHSLSMALAGTMVLSLAGTRCGGSKTSTPTPVLTSVTLSSNSVVGGGTVTGTVTLSSAAPSSGATVALQSNNTAVATVPVSVVVGAGASTMTFTVSTTVVQADATAVITASFSGTSQTATLAVTRVVPIANFTVLSTAAVTLSNGTTLPVGTADTCPLVNSGNPALACTFNGSSSTGAGLNQWSWTYLFGTKTQSETIPTASLTPTASGCGLFGGQSGTTSGGLTFLQMEVRLVVRDASGQLSTIKSNQNVRIFPQKLCGYAF